MRFTFATFVLALSATTVAARAINEMETRSTVTDLGKFVGQTESTLGVDKILDDVDHALNGGLKRLEDQLGVSFAEKLLAIAKKGGPKGTLQAVGQALKQLLKGVDVKQINKDLSDATGGAVVSLEKTLGIKDVQKALDLGKLII
ncbi:hypothetical protein BGZ63DRAFT_248580 [Mariannaea sp. PMI_226]|nr:hypothetical protein BGZ63DRAFT_248580 [Mariannaea sp. PMI_226]